MNLFIIFVDFLIQSLHHAFGLEDDDRIIPTTMTETRLTSTQFHYIPFLNEEVMFTCIFGKFAHPDQDHHFKTLFGPFICVEIEDEEGCSYAAKVDALTANFTFDRFVSDDLSLVCAAEIDFCGVEVSSETTIVVHGELLLVLMSFCVFILSINMTYLLMFCPPY